MNIKIARQIAYHIRTGAMPLDDYPLKRDGVYAAFHKLDSANASTQAQRSLDRRDAQTIWDYVGKAARAGNHVSAMPAQNSYS